MSNNFKRFFIYPCISQDDRNLIVYKNNLTLYLQEKKGNNTFYLRYN